jgi:hypothetical protein
MSAMNRQVLTDEILDGDSGSRSSEGQALDLLSNYESLRDSCDFMVASEARDARARSLASPHESSQVNHLLPCSLAS